MSVDFRQRALEAHQLKTAVERTTLNDIHMQTIKVRKCSTVNRVCTTLIAL